MFARQPCDKRRPCAHVTLKSCTHARPSKRALRRQSNNRQFSHACQSASVINTRGARRVHTEHGQQQGRLATVVPSVNDSRSLIQLGAVQCLTLPVPTQRVCALGESLIVLSFPNGSSQYRKIETEIHFDGSQIFVMCEGIGLEMKTISELSHFRTFGIATRNYPPRTEDERARRRK